MHAIVVRGEEHVSRNTLSSTTLHLCAFVGSVLAIEAYWDDAIATSSSLPFFVHNCTYAPVILNKEASDLDL